ncbi:uncharacterized protein PGTG_20653 [Puccinia graminis f. sp. tritici CRL 75-36-700-3]|uniref:Secreted protein n=1 Tax=Puccinia graminis f. sp. tritici (strain CRL 75-36-700-3 / race SCCL) TaxID=418459 RepID=H6QPC0_PUCGT|nr:uncharacterized protein PGTG_20653 [Puccinia graminis f. sp. tritici CRL 75-36-700-3]EHS63555.1 hypothetical protein PGTG_20653 [Puccinia graminis f. sp. tritici CRL 75-36-700-3]
MQFSTLFVLSMMLLFLTHETCCFSWVCLGEGATVCSAPVTKSEKSRNRDLKDFWVSDAKGAGTNLFTCDDVLPGGHLATRGWCCIFKSLKSNTITTAELYQCLVGYNGLHKRSTIG